MRLARRATYGSRAPPADGRREQGKRDEGGDHVPDDGDHGMSLVNAIGLGNNSLIRFLDHNVNDE